MSKDILEWLRNRQREQLVSALAFLSEVILVAVAAYLYSKNIPTTILLVSGLSSLSAIARNIK